MTDAFEKAFDNFLDKQEYDAAQAAIFSLVRAAFQAGWQAAQAECSNGCTQTPNP